MFTRESVAAGVSAATTRKAAAIAEYEAATAELEWLQQGAMLLGLDVPKDEASELDELAASHASGKRPTLRQAILTLATEAPDMQMTIPALAAALRARDWLPDRADAQKGVSDMAAAMATDDLLERIGRGVISCIRDWHWPRRAARLHRLVQPPSVMPSSRSFRTISRSTQPRYARC